MRAGARCAGSSGFPSVPSVRTQLTLRVPISHAATWLVPRLPAFQESFWHVDLEIRQGSGSWPGFHATRLRDDTAVAICGPVLLRRHGVHRCFDADSTERPLAGQAMVVDASIVALEMVAAGTTPTDSQAAHNLRTTSTHLVGVL